MKIAAEVSDLAESDVCLQGSKVGQGDGLPACNRMYSLMHPFDPVCYRCIAA